MQRKRDTAGMLDYVFASDELIRAEHSLEIGKPDDWLSHSDHMPLIFDVSLESVG